jgi:GNAT superfamily N-acetyltransferase
MINRLDWDSNFFGVETGKLVVEENQIIDSANFNDFDFVYIFSDLNLSEEQLKIKTGKIHLADQKVVYHKFLKESSDISTDIHSFDKNRLIPEQLYDLAIQSGHYSRFSTDPNISRSSFERLYKIWLERSVSRDIADEVFVYQIDDLVRGFVTLGIKSGRPDIGLVAVNAKHRSLGIGAILLQAAENWALTKKHSNEIQVVTQGENKGACQFYEKNGYSIDSVTYIYHWWN